MKEYPWIDEDVTSFLSSYYEQQMQKRRMVSKKEYLCWLVGFMEGKGIRYIDTESILYDATVNNEQKEMVLAISTLYSVIEDFCSTHAIKQEIHESEVMGFPYGEYVFETEGYYFSIMTIIGQGAITIFSILTKEEAENLADFFIAADDFLN